MQNQLLNLLVLHEEKKEEVLGESKTLIMTTTKITAMREDRQLLMITHLSQLLDLVTGIGGFIVPLVIWLTQKDKILGMDAHGKMILNFQISIFIYSIVSIPLILLFGLGIFLLIGIGIIAIVFPIMNAIRVNNNEIPSYPLSLNIIK